MRSNLQRRLAAALAAVLVLVVVAIGASWRNARQDDATAEWVVHTHKVLGEVEHVLRLNVDIGTGLRGYLITRQEEFLEPYVAARRELPEVLQHLLELTADNTEQQRRVGELQRLSNDHANFLEGMANTVREQGIEIATLRNLSGEGKRLLDGVRAAVAQIRAEEERLLVQREQVSREANRWARIALTALAAVIVALVIAAYWMLQRYLAGRLYAERALRDNEESLTVTLHSIGDAVLATDVVGRVTRMNPVAERLTGWMAFEAEGRPVAEVFRIVNEQTRQPALVPVDKVLATGALHGLANHTVLIARDGTEWPIADSAAPIRRADGQVVGVVLTFRDVAEERLAEQSIRQLNETLEQRVRERTTQLREGEAQMRTVLENITDGVALSNLDGQLLYFNRAAIEAHGFVARDEYLRRLPEFADTFELSAQDGTILPVGQWPLARILCGEALRDLEINIRHVGEGWKRILNYGGTLVRDADGQPLHAVVTMRDITESKRDEMALRAAKEDLERRVTERTAELTATSQELAIKNSQLEQANQLKSEFLANMSHELRTPLNAIIGFSEILREGLAGGVTPKQREFANDIHVSGAHLLSLINEILDLSKIEAGSMYLEREAVAVAPLLESCLAVVRDRASARRLDLRAEVDPTLGTIEGDGQKLRQIVYNLLSNAVKFAEPGGRVRLDSRRVDRLHIATVGASAGRVLSPSATDEEFVEIVVDDSGVGIAAADLTRLFEPFVQVDSSITRRHEGTGLGLALVRRLTDLHGGGLAVTSAPGQGSRFVVWLPYRPRTPPRHQSVPPPTARVQTLALVIEDDDASATLLRRELDSHGIAVIRASTAEEGLVLALKRRPDLIVLDIFLPHIDGWECLNRLKRNKETADIPVVIVTVSSELQRGLALGAVRVLQKPVARESLLATLTELGLDGTPPPTVLVVDDDPAAVKIVASILQSVGMNVLRAYSGREAIDIALSARPDLLVLDIIMPDISGFDVVAALKVDPQGQSIPIVIVTAKRLSDQERAKLNGQVLRVVDKSDFDGANFLTEVRRALTTMTVVPI